MPDNTTYYETFRPLLHQFCEATHNLNMDGNFSTIFLPHVMNGYTKSSRRIFYFGRDTNGWSSTDGLLGYFKRQELDYYIDETNVWINGYEFLDYNKNRPAVFWTLAMKLHLRLKGVQDKIQIGSSLAEEYQGLLNDFGWGNTNAIEVPDSLKKQGVWDSIDKNKYWQIKEKSKIFDRLKWTISSFQPDLVFIFNWQCDDKMFLEGLTFEVQELDLVNNHFWVCHFPAMNTKLIWTIHPNNLRFQGMGVDDLIDIILPHVS